VCSQALRHEREELGGAAKRASLSRADVLDETAQTSVVRLAVLIGRHPDADDECLHAARMEGAF